MADFQVLIPKLGESIQEATITKIFVQIGDSIKEDDVLFEVATDKVDSEIPSPVSGIVKAIYCKVDDLLAVGKVAMLIGLPGEVTEDVISSGVSSGKNAQEEKLSVAVTPPTDSKTKSSAQSGRYYSPLVRNLASQSNLPLEELDGIQGSGIGGRVRKNDLLQFLEERKNPELLPTSHLKSGETAEISQNQLQVKPKVSLSIGAEDTIIEMDRIRKLIANHMVHSKQTAPHVTAFVEADVTEMVLWRNRVKDEFQKKYGEKLTFLPLITEAVAKALCEYPFVNSSVDGDRIILRKRVNIGIAVATNQGNLVVPVLKDAEAKNRVGLTKEINRFAEAGRNEKLQPDDLSGGTFTITNFGSFGNVMGTPIINQPQVAILAIGTIEKKPAVIETVMGDAIVVRHKVFLSLSYDHRIVDGMLGGKFLKRIADLLEAFDGKQVV
ncbi:MAG: 2-oxo acid dehydrogenase subunit E2 [Marinilabiliales bacterium]|nr:2-oxo acid dehydrogenase subunit E2 [Marinilabiliales bacterium]